VLFSWLCWPAIWDWGIQGFITSFSIFSKFHAPLIVRAFGVEWPDSSTPWWYPFLWLPVGLTPFALVIVVCGLIEGASTVNHRSWRFSDTPTLRLWLFLWCIATFSSLILLRPKLYDEDRHIFFTTPPLLILAGLSLERWSERAKILTSIVLCVTATLTYSSWRQYSYVYKSPIIGEVTGRSFLNDYWGVCVPTVIRYFPKLIPPDATIHLIAYQPIAEMQYRRLFGEGPFSRYSGFGPYYFTRRTPDLPTFYVLRHNRPGMPSVDQVIPNGRKTLLHQELLPSKEEACSLYRITHE
jgi:hypothetical protein